MTTNTLSVLDAAAGDTGWNDDSRLAVLRDCIEETQETGAWRDALLKRARDESQSDATDLSRADAAADDIVRRMGWNTDSLIRIAAEYLDGAGLSDDARGYIEGRAAEEFEMANGLAIEL